MPASAHHRSLRDLLSRFSVEVTSVDTESIDAACRSFPPGTEVFIASLPNVPPATMVAGAVRLREAGMTPVPHIVARNLADEAQLATVLAELQKRAGVDRVLALAGDRDRPAGSLHDSLQLIESGQFEAHGLRHVYLSGYPEGHPGIAGDVLLATTRAKIVSAHRRGLGTTLVSQFCFDASAIVQWTGGLRRAGIAVPCRVGVAGPASRANLIKFALICGVGPSLKALRGRGALAKGLLQTETPQALLEDVASAQAADASLGIAGVHFFTFGSIARTARWIEEAVR